MESVRDRNWANFSISYIVLKDWVIEFDEEKDQRDFFTEQNNLFSYDSWNNSAFIKRL